VLVIQSRVSVFCLLRDSAGSFGLLCLFVTCYLSSPLVDVDVVSGGVRMAGSFTEPWPCFRAPVDGDGGAGSLVVDVAKAGLVLLASAPFWAQPFSVRPISQPGTNTTFHRETSCDRCQVASCCVGIYTDARRGFHIHDCCAANRVSCSV
jgi:hypothetical protein